MVALGPYRDPGGARNGGGAKSWGGPERIGWRKDPGGLRQRVTQGREGTVLASKPAGLEPREFRTLERLELAERRNHASEHLRRFDPSRGKRSGSSDSGERKSLRMSLERLILLQPYPRGLKGASVELLLR